MFGLMIRDVFALRKKIYLLFAILGIGDILLLISAFVLGNKYENVRNIQKLFKGGIMAISFLAMLVVFFMVSIVVNDKEVRWNKLLMTFPLSGSQKGAARYFIFFIISFIAGILELIATFAMFKLLKYDIQVGTVKYVFCPFAIGLAFVYVRMILEYIQNTQIAKEYCVILAVFIVASSLIIYKFGGIDFPAVTSEVIKIYMEQFDKWIVYIIPCLMALGILCASDKMMKPKNDKRIR